MTRGMVGAHLDGRTPVSPWLPKTADCVFATTRDGEVVWGKGDHDQRLQLRELQFYWQKIPDFGPKEFRVIPDEAGWAAFIYWGGMERGGKVWRLMEADRVTTDAEFNVTRYEVHCELGQWRRLAASIDGSDPATFTALDYDRVLAAQPG